MAVRMSGLVALLSILVSGCGGGPGATLGQTAALHKAVQEVQKALSASIAQADEAAANNIKRLSTEADRQTKQLQELLHNFDNVAAAQREDVARQGFTLLDEARRLVDQTNKDAVARLNEGLAAASALLDAVPFVDVDDAVFAVTPFKLRSDATDREISIYGHFPSMRDSMQGVVVYVEDAPVQVKRSVGKLAFDLPQAVVNAGRPISNLRIQFPKRGWFSRTPTPIHSKVRIVNATPYTFVIETQRANPLSLETVVGNGHSETANSGNTDRSPHLPVEQLFNTTVPNHSRYLANTAQIVNIAIASQGGGKPCASCPEPTGRVVGWNSQGVDLALSAPNCGVHTVMKRISVGFGSIEVPEYVCGGGGSNFGLTIVPTFTVRVAGVSETTPIDARKLRAGWKSVSTVPLPDDWQSILAKMSFDDNFDKGETALVMKKGVDVQASPLFDLKVENNQLLITAR